MTTTRWSWADGSRDERERRLFLTPALWEEVPRSPGEAATAETDGFAARAWAATPGRAFWMGSRVLPRGTQAGVPARRHLQRAARALTELPGPRGAGDYGRSEGVATNLEFDTVLALARLGLWYGDSQLLDRARRGARHLVDVDLDRRSGLPFRHGPDHRLAAPEPGHCWLQGLLLVGCLTADDELIGAARSMARGLVSHPDLGSGREERARDRAWPLWELETWLRFEDDPVVAVAADRLAAEIVARFDHKHGFFRFGEGRRRGGVHVDRLWITGGIVLPALVAHEARTEDPRVASVVERARRSLLGFLLAGRDGVPVSAAFGPEGTPFSTARASEDGRAWMLFEGLSDAQRRQCLGRRTLRDALGLVPVTDDPDRATVLTMAARGRWVYGW